MKKDRCYLALFGGYTVVEGRTQSSRMPKKDKYLVGKNALFVLRF